MKICKKCNKEKVLKDFHKNKNKKDGVNNWCKECCRIYKKKYFENNKEKIYLKRDKDKKRKWDNAYYIKHKDKIKEKQKEYYIKNKERIKSKVKEWRNNNRKFRNRYEVVRNNSSYEIKLNRRITCGVYRALKLNKQSKSWKDFLEFTLEELKYHIESRFKDGMSWDNMNEWQIDHIVPKSLFIFNSAKDREFKMCWCLNNLQPMWATENNSKNAKLNYYTDEEYKRFKVFDILQYVKNR